MGSTAAAEGSELWCGFVSHSSMNGVEQKVVEWTGECSSTNQCLEPLAKRGVVCGLASSDELPNAPQPKLKTGNDRNGPEVDVEPKTPRTAAVVQTPGMPV